MKTKDLVYIGIIGYLAYLILKKKPTSNASSSTTNPTVGNAKNGGLNLGSNMDLPNLTPTPANGLSAEVALNSSNVSPLIKDDNEPTQIFGGITLPAPYVSTSVVNPNPIDIIPVAEISTYTTPSEEIPSLSTVANLGESLVAEPIFPIKTIKAELITNQPDMGNAIPIKDDMTDEMILQCGDSFSIANDDKEGSYSNFWFDGTNYYTQTTSPFIKTIPTKISKLAFIEGCKKMQLLISQNSKG